MADTTIEQVQHWIERLNSGDEDARNHLIEVSQQRLEKLTRKMLRGFPKLKRWSETADVQQNASLRLWKSLAGVAPASVVEYFRFAATQIRRELIDLSRHYLGPQGLGANHHSWKRRPDCEGSFPADPEAQIADEKSEAANLLQWTAFHNQVEQLPEEEKAAFDLLWYQDLTQEAAAEVLGIKFWALRRRYRRAKEMLHQALKEEWPL